MEKHTCKLCFRSFANGRALGGHMRFHVTSNKPIIPIKESSSSSSFSSSKAPFDVVDTANRLPLICYKLRENPKKSTRLIVHDFESDTDSSHDLRRSKRVRKSLPESEPVSSVSSATMEEDVAISLMMLSRDNWHKSEEVEVVPEEDDDDDADVGEEGVRIRPINPKRSKYQCGTCKKVFRSYQALGGHRASHKKANGCAPPPPVKIYEVESVANNVSNNNNNVERIDQHECTVCYRVFSSGQALGGHKRSHLMANSTANFVNKSINGESWIDLNLPAPMEDDAELSAVCDA